MAEEIVMATSKSSCSQEIILKEAEVHKIDSGDILVVQLREGTAYADVKDVTAALEDLKNTLEANHKKKIYFLVVEAGDVEITQYRAEAAKTQQASTELIAPSLRHRI